MAIKFCRECNNLLNLKMEGDMIQYLCNKCETTADIESPVIYMNSFRNNHESDLNQKKNMLLDPTLPRLKKKCSKCSNNICFSYMEKSEKKALNSYYVCTKCLYEWTD